MPLDPDTLQRHMPLETRHDLTWQQTVLYALGAGVGLEDATGPEAMRLAYETDLAALPSMASILAYPGFWQKQERFGLTWQKILHGEQSVRIHRTLPVEGRLRGVTTIDGIFDKGAEKGALVYSRREIFEESSNALVATIVQGSFLRGDGGFGGDSAGAPVPHPVPERAPDKTLDLATQPGQALLYRLSGDFNPLHVDPEVARQGGFDRPILHGLCTYAVATRALVTLLCGGNPDRLRRIDCRFSRPVYPGETISVRCWHEAPGRAAFQAGVRERDLIVLTIGYAEFEEKT